MKKNRLLKKIKSQKGFVATVDALIFIMLVGYGTTQYLKVEKKQQQNTDILASGEMIAQFNNGLRSYVSAVGAGPAPAAQVGVDWLKSPACGGLASNPAEGYLPCSMPGVTALGQTYSTSFAKVGNELTATTDITGLSAPSIPLDSQGRVANEVALRAAATPGFSQNAFGSYTANPGVNLAGANPSAQANYGTVRAIASNAVNTDNWLRTDGSNTPNATIDWNTQDINNVGQFDSDDITNSASITTNTLTSSGVTNNGTLTNNGSAVVTGDLTSNSKIYSDELEVSGSLLTSGNNVAVGDKLIAGDVLATDLNITGGAYLSKAVYDVRIVQNNTSILRPTCPAGTNPFIFTSASSMFYQNGGTARAIYGIQTKAQYIAPNWRVYGKVLLDNGTWADPANASDYLILVIIKCT